MVVSDYYGTVRVAKDDLSTHVDELVYKEQAAFEHLLVDQYASFGLGGHYEHHAQQVGCQSRPGGVGNGHDGAVDE